MSKFFVKDIDKDSKLLYIEGEDVNHIKNVLRMKCCDKLTVSDSNGIDYLVKIKSFENNKILCYILNESLNETEPNVNVTLFQGLPKFDKMDYIIQKSVELGVNKIIPIITERVIVKLKGANEIQKRVERWNKISIEAAKQSKRGIVPNVLAPISFEELLKDLDKFDLSLLLYENETNNNFKSIVSNSKRIKDLSVIIGPEGGFSEKEVQKACLKNAKCITLGSRILRTETASIAVLSIIMYELGNI